ncbi:hypothetical protein GCM10020331_050360 [Ectobacillus funiculus]
MPAILTLILVLVASSIVTGVLGMGIERVAYRPLRKAPKLITLITAIGVSFLLQDIVRFITEFKKGNYIITAPSLFTDQVTIHTSSMLSVFNNAQMRSSSFILIMIAIVMMVALDFFVNRTRWGMAMRAVAQDRETAALMSVNVNKVISLTFFIGSALGGATGVLFAIQYGTIDPYIGFILGMKAFYSRSYGRYWQYSWCDGWRCFYSV